MIEIPVSYTIRLSESKIIEAESLTKQSTSAEIESACYHYLAGLDDLEFYPLTLSDRKHIIEVVRECLANTHGKLPQKLPNSGKMQKKARLAGESRLCGSSLHRRSPRHEIIKEHINFVKLKFQRNR